MNDDKAEDWNRSYLRDENCVLFPKEECVKFLSRFVRNKCSNGDFIDRRELPTQPQGLDFGCGMGRQTQLLYDFGLEGYGVDLSSVAIDKAKQIHPTISECFQVIGADERLPFQDEQFSVAIAESVLDSMSFDLAKNVMKELDRVTDGLLFLSLVSATCNKQGGYLAADEVVNTQHEYGTIQSYYDLKKVELLLENTQFKIKWYSLQSEKINSDTVISFSRYYIVLSNDE